MVAVLLGLMTVATASPASAHAVLVSSTPADGSRLEAAPAEVRLTFDEAVSLVPGMAKVLASDGTRVDTGSASLDSSGTRIVIPLKHGVGRGSYLVTWRVISADTHVVSGSISFGVQQAAESAAAAPPTSRTSLDIAVEAAEGLLYLGVILGLGVAAATVMLWPSARRLRRVRGAMTSGWALIVLSSGVLLLAQGPRAQASGWSGLLRGDDLSQTLSSAYGRELVVRMALALAFGFLVPRLDRARRGVVVVATVTALGLLLTIALAGHAAVGSDAGVAVPMAVLHLAGISVWLGGLAVLVLAFREATAEARQLRRWSTVAFSSVAVVVVSGGYQAWRQLKPFASLWATDYGLVLLVKVALVGLVLGCAVWARRALASSLTALPRMRPAIAIEALLSVIVVAITAVLVSTPPASSTYGPSRSLTAAIGPDRMVIEVTSTRRGPQKIVITPLTASGKPLHLETLQATLSSSALGVAALEVPLVRGPGQTWLSQGASVPLAGRWTLTLYVSLDQATGYATQVAYDVW